MMDRLIRSKAAVAVLSVALFSESIHLREVARQAKVSPFEAKRELDNLEDIGALKKEKKANLSLYSPNEGCPFLKDLKSLYVKMDGLPKGAKKAASAHKAPAPKKG